MDGNSTPAAGPSIYSLRAEKKARTALFGGIVGALLSLAVFAFLFLVPSSSGRGYPALVVMAGSTVWSVFMACRGYRTLGRIRSASRT